MDINRGAMRILFQSGLSGIRNDFFNSNFLSYSKAETNHHEKVRKNSIREIIPLDISGFCGECSVKKARQDHWPRHIS